MRVYIYKKIILAQKWLMNADSIDIYKTKKKTITKCNVDWTFGRCLI